jgi:hypothetical protein
MDSWRRHMPGPRELPIRCRSWGPCSLPTTESPRDDRDSSSRPSLAIRRSSIGSGVLSLESPALLMSRLPSPLAVATHGQSYLAWNGDQLCQTPISYLTEANRWGNSPGVYVDGTADFARPATARCLDCHNTWFALAPGSVNRYDKRQNVLGVSCVRCHGPARDHVRYHRQFPNERQPQVIVNPRNLSRERANDVCAQCHSGAGESRRPAFTYKPGEPLEKWLAIELDAADPGNDDPHAANQLGRLMRSRCYQQSGTLTCMDCHDAHAQERGNTKLFSNRCQNCHATADCGLSEKYTTELTDRCVGVPHALSARCPRDVAGSRWSRDAVAARPSDWNLARCQSCHRSRMEVVRPLGRIAIPGGASGCAACGLCSDSRY